ncbi:pilus assembly protein PilL [Cupriavidus pauculus]|uniref:pilus assembly protein PilL n=1 Tax=Cupriavidus pauculus TaxID=82633 RepID=UPI001EE36261|nr:pilus assembly protein PilL [Cupriavidus pauculus]GJG97757.1 TrbG/VirB9 family P-type conjugative transfer protein [Cupriavidus pauculus]
MTEQNVTEHIVADLIVAGPVGHDAFLSDCASEPRKTMRRDGRPRTTGFRSRVAVLSAMALAAIGAAWGPAHAADTDPLDFEYRVIASAANRPAIVFNDGQWTYLQHRPGQVIRADGAVRSGPYWLIEGVPDTLRYEVDGQPVLLKRKASNGFLADTSPDHFGHGELADLPSVVAQRLVIRGDYQALGALRAATATLPLSEMVRAIVPRSWRGAADRDVSLTENVTLRIRDGENWLQALGRLMTVRNLYADVDFARRHITLRTTPSEGLFLQRPAPIEEAATQDTVMGMVASMATKATSTAADTATGTTTDTAPDTAAGTSTPRETARVAAPMGHAAFASTTNSLMPQTDITAHIAVPSQSSLLATVVGVRAIRDNKAGSIELRMAPGSARFGESVDEMTWRDTVGRELSTKWNAQEELLSFPTVDRFVVSRGDRHIEVARVPGVRYVFFDKKGAVGARSVGVERVFEENGATYLVFSRSRASISAIDENGQRGGEHRDRYFKFDGIASSLTVAADGKVFRVRRIPEVRFSEREVSTRKVATP